MALHIAVARNSRGGRITVTAVILCFSCVSLVFLSVCGCARALADGGCRTLQATKVTRKGYSSTHCLFLAPSRLERRVRSCLCPGAIVIHSNAYW